MRKLLSAALLLVSLTLTPTTAFAWGSCGGDDSFDGCESCCETLEGFYIGGVGGVSWAHESYWSDSDNIGDLLQLSYEAGFQVGGFLGFRFCNGFRIEGEISYRELDLDKGKFYDGSSVTTESNLSSKDWNLVNYMANFLFECSYQACGCCVRPYFGGGVGACQVNVEVNYEITGYTLRFKEDDWVLACQAIMGIDFPVSECMDIGIAYRYLILDEPHFVIAGRRIESREWIGHHNVSVTAKYLFGGLY